MVGRSVRRWLTSLFSIKDYSAVYATLLFLQQVFLFLKMYGLLELANGPVNTTLVTLGTGLLPLLFHFLFVNMKFSMLKKKKGLGEDARQRLETHVLRQLDKGLTIDGPEASIGESVIPVDKRDEESEEEDDEMDHDKENNPKWWMVGQYHLTQIGEA